VPGWKELRELNPVEASVYQYAYTVRTMLSDSSYLDNDRIVWRTYESIMANPALFQRDLYAFLGVPFTNGVYDMSGEVQQPTSDPAEILSVDDIRLINETCEHVFTAFGYEQWSV